MSKVLNLIFLSILMSISSVSTKEIPGYILLTNYTYSCLDREVGQIVIPGLNNEEVKFRLRGKNAKRFTLDENNRIFIKEVHCCQDESQHNLVIRAKIAEKIIVDTVLVIRDKFIQNKVIAHRGAWKHTKETENSIGALKKAIDMGCEMSELDVNLSADGVLFVNHDAHIQGVKIDTAKSTDLSKIKLSNGEHLPTLEAYIEETMKQSRTRLLIEVKPFSVSKDRGLAAAEATVELVRKMRAQAWVYYISFSYDILKKIKELDPFAKVAYLNGDKSPDEIKENGFWGIDYYYRKYQEHPEWIEQAENLGLTVNGWVINKSELMDWFIEKDVRYITTDEPEMLFNKLNEENKP